MSRRKGRVLAFQTLYSWDVASVPVDDLLSFSWIESDDPSKESVKDEEICSFARLLVMGTIEHIEEIDKWDTNIDGIDTDNIIQINGEDIGYDLRHPMDIMYREVLE